MFVSAVVLLAAALVAGTVLVRTLTGHMYVPPMFAFCET